MIRELLSDLSKMFVSPYQIDSFQPYLSLMFFIVTLTVLAYNIQTITITLHAYAKSPLALNDNILQVTCQNLEKATLPYTCVDIRNSKKRDYNLLSFLSPVQDLHKSMK